MTSSASRRRRTVQFYRCYAYFHREIRHLPVWMATVKVCALTLTATAGLSLGDYHNDILAHHLHCRNKARHRFRTQWRRHLHDLGKQLLARAWQVSQYPYIFHCCHRFAHSPSMIRNFFATDWSHTSRAGGQVTTVCRSNQHFPPTQRVPQPPLVSSLPSPTVIFVPPHDTRHAAIFWPTRDPIRAGRSRPIKTNVKS
jgi:hypothetical protein